MKRRTGFTLIELLVVIAIIAILAAILFPVFLNAKVAAQRSACISNLKEIGMALRMYTDDNSQIVPVPVYPADDTSAAKKLYWHPTLIWRKEIVRYVKTVGVFNCPGRGASVGQSLTNLNMNATSNGSSGDIGYRMGHYGINPILVCDYGSYIAGGQGHGTLPNINTVNSKAIFVGEVQSYWSYMDNLTTRWGDVAWSTTSEFRYIDNIHTGMVNYLTFDGAVHSVKVAPNQCGLDGSPLFNYKSH